MFDANTFEPNRWRPGDTVNVPITITLAVVLLQIQSFMNSRDDLGANVPALNQALETVRANIEWRAANEETFIRWLKAATP